MPTVPIRAYEQKNLPLEERLTSLARRFSTLKNAHGVSPFAPEILYDWISQSSDIAVFQTGLLMLQLAGYDTTERFDLLLAMSAWDEDDRQMFINFLRVWDF
ncbi:MAG: hypothetical protein JXX14_00275 [Deltaproteobacteria bacterium]|nr:hypothetical protein [Deltaproteobacteria bacterium]